MSHDVYLTANQLKDRYGGLSEMTLWRWVKERRNNFPSPTYINGRRFWLLRTIEAWERSNACQKASA